MTHSDALIQENINTCTLIIMCFELYALIIHVFKKTEIKQPTAADLPFYHVPLN